MRPFLFLALLFAVLYPATPIQAQCTGFPATIADADCSGGTPMSNNMNANSGTYGYCGSSSSSASYSGINLNGATLRVCGNATLGFGSWNSGSLVVSCGSTVTINSNVTLNSNSGIVNYGTLIINGSLTYQNSNNFVYNELPSSKLTVTGNINFPTNNGTNGYLKNAGYIKVNGSYNSYGGGYTCFLDGGRMECNNLVYMDNNANCNGVPGNRFTFGSATGSCILRYTGSATLYKVFTASTRWNIYQAAGSSQSIASPCNGNATGWGSATLVSSAPAISAPTGEQGCSTITCLTLPVELLKFFAIPDDKQQVVLSWATASETNCDYFSVERSSDALSWSLIATVPGNGTTNTRHDYNYTDSSPVAGISYYRLSQHDFGGKRRYFAPVYADRGAGVETFGSSLYPNPSVSGKVTLGFSGTGEAPIAVRVMDVLGNLVSEAMIYPDQLSGHSGSLLLELPQSGSLFFVNLFQQDKVLARHKVCVLRD